MSFVSTSVFASLVGVPVGISISAAGLKICPLTAGIKKYKSIIKNKRKNYDRILLLAKTKLNTIEVMISKGVSDSYIKRGKICFSK